MINWCALTLGGCILDFLHYYDKLLVAFKALIFIKGRDEIHMNYYDVFGVSPTASSEDIANAHKALSKKYHPDINSDTDAHEKMVMLNEANEVLSNQTKRKEYDRGLKLNQQRIQHRDISSSRVVKAKPSYETKVADERTEKAEFLRRKAESKLKTQDAVRAQREELEKQRAKETGKKSRQVRYDVERQHILDTLSSVVIDGNKQLRNNIEIDEERHNATKVLLSMVRNDNEHLRRKAEEAERKKNIEEILSLVKEYNAEAE